MLAMLSYAEGCRYHPIALSRRSIAAILGYRGARSEAKGASILEALLKFRLLTKVEIPEEKRSSLYVVGFNLKAHETFVGFNVNAHKGNGSGAHKSHQCGAFKLKPPLDEKKAREERKPTTTDTYIVDEHEVVENTLLKEQKEKLKKEVVVDSNTFIKDEEVKTIHQDEYNDAINQVRDLFDNKVAVKKIQALIALTSLENVQNQLKWWKHRDVSSFASGPPAAFCTFCSQEMGEPDVLLHQQRVENEQRLEKKKRLEDELLTEEKKKREMTKKKLFDEIWTAMSEEEKIEYKKKVIDEMPYFYRYDPNVESRMAFVGFLQCKVLEGKMH
jgi:hypothetical protein